MKHPPEQRTQQALAMLATMQPAQLQELRALLAKEYAYFTHRNANLAGGLLQLYYIVRDQAEKQEDIKNGKLDR